MPNPLFLRVMDVSLAEYNTYSSEKRERFQQLAAKKLAEVQSTDMDAYIKLTEPVESSTTEEKSEWENE